MEAVKDRFTRIRRNARPFVVDADPDLVAHSRSRNLDQPARRRKAHRVIEDIVDCAREPVGLAHHGCGILARAGESDSRAIRFAAALPTRDQLLDQRAEVDPVERGAGELGVGPRGFADVVDEPV